MATIRFRVKQDSTKNVIEMIVTHGRMNRTRFSTGIKADVKYWDAKEQRFKMLKGRMNEATRKANEQREIDNSKLDKLNQKAKDIIEELEQKNQNWTLNQFRTKFENKEKQTFVSLYFEEHIKTLFDTNHVGNAKCYEATYHIIKLYDKKFDKKTFSEIDLKYIKSFEVWLEKRGCKGNTRMYYHRAFRALLNKAIEDKICSRETYPYGTDGFKVSKLANETEKRYLPSKYLNKLKTQSSSNNSNEFARLAFLFMYYAYGMSFIDMALLKKSDIRTLENGKYIVYTRQKIKNNKEARSIKIILTDNLKEIIEKMCEFEKPLNGYLLPIVTRKKDTEEELYEHIFNRRKRIGKNLKLLSTEFEFDFNLTSYVSRHTMAMQLQDNDLPEAHISQILNHSDLRTTKTYLAELETKKIDKAADIL